MAVVIRQTTSLLPQRLREKQPVPVPPFPFAVQLQSFDGPLDVLLTMIRQQDVDIHDIPIAEVTEQYLGWLKRATELDLEIAGAFIVMAADLCEIKSRMLLPKPPKEAPEGPDPREELAQRLLEYEKFKEVAALLQGQEEARRLLYSRTVDADPDDFPAVAAGGVTSSELLSALQRALARVPEPKAAPTTIPRQKISMRMKMNEIVKRVRAAAGQLSFTALLDDSSSRTEIVITFLALLELVRLGQVQIWQKQQWGEILLKGGDA